LAKSRYLYYLQAVAHRSGLWKTAMRIEKFNSADVPELSPDFRKWMIENVYGEKNRELGLLLNVDLEHWNRY
jgi:hypothetical protein